MSCLLYCLYPVYRVHQLVWHLQVHTFFWILDLRILPYHSYVHMHIRYV